MGDLKDAIESCVLPANIFGIGRPRERSASVIARQRSDVDKPDQPFAVGLCLPHKPRDLWQSGANEQHWLGRLPDLMQRRKKGTQVDGRQILDFINEDRERDFPVAGCVGYRRKQILEVKAQIAAVRDPTIIRGHFDIDTGNADLKGGRKVPQRGKSPPHRSCGSPLAVEVDQYAAKIRHQ